MSCDQTGSELKILVRCPNWVGDCVMATPAIRTLRQSLPSAYIALLLREYTLPVLDPNPWSDEILICDDRSVGGALRISSLIRRRRFDVALVLPNSFRTALEAWLARIPKRIGYALNARYPFLTDPIEPPQEEGKRVPINMVDYYLRLSTELGCKPSSKQEELFFTTSTEQEALKLLEKYGWKPGEPLLAVNPGAKYGSSKCWEAEKFAIVTDEVSHLLNAKSIILFAPGEETIASAVAKSMKTNPILPLTEGIPLDLLKPIIRHSTLLITNDTGTRHYAVAFDVPVVVIFGPTDTRYTDVNLDKTSIVRVELDCAPCQKKSCPEGHHKCMRSITPEMVIESALGLLEKVRSSQTQ